ncbi:MAG: hypothetical protein PUD60_05575 [Akkermansia muciniphila]|nr:hypothetical protein [Akkermansia muciniphila]
MRYALGEQYGVLAFSDTPQDENPSGLDFQWVWVHNRNTNQINALWQTRSRREGRYSAAMKEEVVWQATLGQKTDEQIASEYQISVAQVQQWRDEGKAAFLGPFGARRTLQK